MHKSLTIVGEKPEGTIIDGNGTGDVIAATTGNVNISNFTVQHCGSWPEFVAAIHLYSASNCAVAGNIVKHNIDGIWLKDSSYNIISNNKITNNSFGILLSQSPTTLFLETT